MTEEIKYRIEQVKTGNVPDGYVKTKAGPMPIAWNTSKKAKEVFKSYTNKKHGNNMEILAATQENGIVPRSQIDIDIKCSDEGISGYKKVSAGDFVISLRSFQGGIEYSPYDGIVSPAYTVLKPIVPISNEYYKNYFKTEEFISRLNGATYGIRDGKQIGYEDFGDLIIHNPPLPEQKKIAEILMQCDKVIALKKERIEEEKKRKKWLIQKLLNPDSGLRLLGFENSKWENCELGVLGDFFKGSGISNDDCTTGETPCVKYGDIYMSYGAWFNNAVSATKEGVASIAPKVEKGALLFTCSGEDPLEIGKCTAYLGENLIAVGGDIAIMIPDTTKVLSLFLAYAQYTFDLIKQKARSGQGYSIVHLYPNQMKKLLVRIPLDMEEQKKIVSILFASENDIDLLQQELSVWQQKKKALMKLLLTGIVRAKI